MLFNVHELRDWPAERQLPYGWVLARPVWTGMGRWKHAWWVFTGRCDAVWWPEDGNPYRRTTNAR